ncbi:DUF5937 family protein [Ornithinimicrobium sp. LYQ92]|uniref:ArsR/SmtB family transcription factor n=1 Tax=Serinicoccus sp. LYQ92 TaxID=3378798 RepID=UPI0038539593
MPIVLDLAGVAPRDVSVRLSPLSELMAVLHLLAEPEHHLDRRREIDQVTRSVPTDLARELRDLSPLWARFRARHLMPLSHRSNGELIEELGALQALEPEAFLAVSAEVIHGTRSEGFGDLLGSARARTAFVDRCGERSEARGSLAMELVRDPGALQRRLVATLGTCDDLFFARMWQQASSKLLGAQADVRAMLARQSLPVVMTALHPGVRYFPSTHHVAFDKLQNAFVRAEHRCYVLVPSLYTSPHIVVKYDSEYAGGSGGLRDLPVVIQFPAAEMGVTTNESVESIQRRLAVMADASRLDILRHLVNEDCTTTELARRTHMSTPQVSRHLRRLREVGLLESERDGRLVRNRLVLRAVYSMGYDLVAGIVR